MTLWASLSWPPTLTTTFLSRMKLSVQSARFSSIPMLRIFRRRHPERHFGAEGNEVAHAWTKVAAKNRAGPAFKEQVWPI